MKKTGKPQRVKAVAELRLDAYQILCDMLERQIAYGWQRAHKHTSTPTPEHIQDEIYCACARGLAELLNFDQ